MLIFYIPVSPVLPTNTSKMLVEPQAILQAVSALWALVQRISQCVDQVRHNNKKIRSFRRSVESRVKAIRAWEDKIRGSSHVPQGCLDALENLKSALQRALELCQKWISAEKRWFLVRMWHARDIANQLADIKDDVDEETTNFVFTIDLHFHARANMSQRRRVKGWIKKGWRRISEPRHHPPTDRGL
ncbi:hypothetical protein JAAARDRAFT_60696 [Jaapia argillacea MUCL 33604]|uniref:Mixed lineage kinase domain-containing protein n=1 Tax=Jaapia argillacea MUCL 33604 TaxID=933084 RepID=A0A067PHK0_9AGAM|nr:hypothetical protein JAAARDRAFT_60696 [Jaapia argillacea MUCL 33604]